MLLRVSSCIWFRCLVVFPPYYINVKGLSRLEVFDTIKSWLKTCNSAYRLDFFHWDSVFLFLSIFDFHQGLQRIAYKQHYYSLQRIPSSFEMRVHMRGSARCEGCEGCEGFNGLFISKSIIDSHDGKMCPEGYVWI